MVVCYCVTKLSVRLGHDNLILARAIAKAVLYYHTEPQVARERSQQ